MKFSLLIYGSAVCLSKLMCLFLEQVLYKVRFVLASITRSIIIWQAVCLVSIEITSIGSLSSYILMSKLSSVKFACWGTSSSWEDEMAGVISPFLTCFSNGFLNNVLLDFIFVTFITKKKGRYGIFISCESINKINGTDSITLSWFPRSFLSKGFRLLSRILLVAYTFWGQEKYVNETVVYNQGNPLSSCSYLQLQCCVWRKFLFSIFKFYKYYEKYVFKTTMIWKTGLAFDVYTSFSQLVRKKAQHKHNGTFLR